VELHLHDSYKRSERGAKAHGHIFVLKFMLKVLHYSSFIFFSYCCVGIALGYGLDDRGSRVRFPAGTENFSLHHRVQNGSGAHPASNPMDTGPLSLGVKQPRREANHSPTSSAEVKE
jgi:hypothetical protein